MMKVVGRAAPLYITTEFASKPLPLTVTIAGIPWGTLCGESPLTIGSGLMIEKLDTVELPPPGVGLESARFATCPAANADAGTTAWRLVALIYVVCSAVPFRDAAVEAIYPVPVRLSVCEGEPARTLDGDTDAIVGAGLFAGATAGLLPLQPASKERVKVETTKSKVP